MCCEICLEEKGVLLANGGSICQGCRDALTEECGSILDSDDHDDGTVRDDDPRRGIGPSW